MENQVQLFNHPEFGGVRVVGDSENPRFCLSDVCKILAIGNPSQVKTRLDKGVISNETLQTAGGMQSLMFINEDGLYDVILDSRKPSAKKFRKWITNQVVPSIRKTGMYINPNAPINPDLLIKIANDMKALAAQRDEFKALAAAKDETINQLQPKADYCEKILQSPNAVPVTVIAKEYGYSGVMFNQLLGSYKIQRRVGGVWTLYQEYIGKGYVVTETVVTNNGGSAMQMKWTQRGRFFLYDFLKARGHMPLCEQLIPDLFGGMA